MILTSNHKKNKVDILEEKLDTLSDAYHNACKLNYKLQLIASKMLADIPSRAIKDKYIDELVELYK